MVIDYCRKTESISGIVPTGIDALEQGWKDYVSIYVNVADDSLMN